MRKADSAAFGARVRERRVELGLSQKKLGDEAGYSQQNIFTIEQGRIQRPDRCATALAMALNTTPQWLLYAEGPRKIGPKYLTVAQLVENYQALSPERKEEISRAIEDDGKKRRKSA